MNRSRFSRIVAPSLAVLLLATTTPAAWCEDMSWPSEDGGSAPKKTDDAPKSKGDDSFILDEGSVPEGTGKPASSGGGLKSESATLADPGAKPQGTTSGAAKVLTGSAKSTMLFGRIDQIASEANVKMPPLKMEAAKLDTSAKSQTLSAQTSESHFSGKVAQSFPMDFSGTWGGTIRVWRYSMSPLSYQIDQAESEKLRNILTPGTAGDVNFTFQNEYGGKIDLEPAQVRIMIPASQSVSYERMMQQQGVGGMGGMMSQMMANMKVPVMLHFGTVSTQGSMEVGVSGNQIDQRVVKNEIRQLAANVLEEQIITRNSSVQASGRAENGYTESVLRFTRQSPTQLYVLAASVDYSGNGQFLRKLIMYGNVVRGQVMNTSPYPTGMPGMGGEAGLSSILNSLGAASGGASNYGSQMNSYMNNPAVRQYLNGAGGGGGSSPYGSHMDGFSQVLNSLNMMQR